MDFASHSAKAANPDSDLHPDHAGESPTAISDETLFGDENLRKHAPLYRLFRQRDSMMTATSS